MTMARVRIAEGAFWLGALAAYFVFPDYLLLGSQIMVAALFALSIDLILGYAGIVSLGHAAFFGVGAYSAGLLATHGWGEPFSGLLVAGAAAGVVGYLTSFLVVRGQDLTRLMITLGVSMLLLQTANRFSGITGGADGLQGMQMGKVLGLFAFDLYGRTAYLYALTVLFALFCFARRLIGSPFGLALRGIRENPRRMPAIGSPVARRLITVYTIAAVIAGVAGALLAQTTQFVALDVLGFNRSAEILIMLILGGTGRLYGGLIGALVFMVAQDHFSGVDPKYWQFWLGSFLVLVVLFARGGVLGGVDRLKRMFRKK
jgi:branched-chain amino acid transport system permease protein